MTSQHKAIIVTDCHHITKLSILLTSPHGEFHYITIHILINFTVRPYSKKSMSLSDHMAST